MGEGWSRSVCRIDRDLYFFFPERNTHDALRRRRRKKRKKKEEEALINYFKKSLSLGRVPNATEVGKTARRMGLAWRGHDDYRQLLASNFPELLRFQEPKGAREFSSVLSGSRYGRVFVDLFFLGKKKFNGGAVGFVLAAEQHTNQLAAAPIKKKSLEHLRAAMTKLIERSVFRGAKTLLCDRERALFSDKFREEMKQKYGMDVRYLTTRSKAWQAERMGRYVKTQLNKLMKQSGGLRWVDFLESVVDDYNGRLVPGTKYKRSSIDASNFKDFMSQKLGVDDVNAVMETAVMDSSTFKNSKWLETMFAFKEGDLVRIALNRAPEEERVTFKKPSSKGYFTEADYVVERRLLSTTKRLSLIPSKYGRKRKRWEKNHNDLL